MVDRERRATRRGRPAGATAARKTDYGHLLNNLPRARAFSEDQIEDIHETALHVLEELGVRVLNAEARRLYRDAGASVDESSLMVRIDRGLVAQCLKTAPSEFDLIGARPER